MVLHIISHDKTSSWWPGEPDLGIACKSLIVTNRPLKIIRPLLLTSTTAVRSTTVSDVNYPMFVRQRMVVDVFGPPVENLVRWESHLYLNSVARSVFALKKDGDKPGRRAHGHPAPSLSGPLHILRHLGLT